MFLHLGKDVVVPTTEIVAIIDLETNKNTVSNKEFIQTAEDEGFVVSLTDSPNSFIITTSKVYLSPISAITLKKRSDEFLKR